MNQPLARRSNAPHNPYPVALVPTDMDQAWTLASAASRAGFYNLNQAQALMVILEGNLLGIAPAAALRGFHVIEGRPSPSSGLMATMVRHCPYMRYRVLERTVRRCALEWSELIDGRWRVVGESDFTLEDAARLGKGVLEQGRWVASKPGSNWAKSPADMLFARAMSRGVRTYCPELTHGPLYLEDEIQDRDDPAPGPVVVEATATRRAPPEDRGPQPVAELADDAPSGAEGPAPSGAEIRAAREKRGWTMGELARAAGLATRDVSAIERGKHKRTEDAHAAWAALQNGTPDDETPGPEDDGPDPLALAKAEAIQLTEQITARGSRQRAEQAVTDAPDLEALEVVRSRVLRTIEAQTQAAQRDTKPAKSSGSKGWRQAQADLEAEDEPDLDDLKAHIRTLVDELEDSDRVAALDELAGVANHRAAKVLLASVESALDRKLGMDAEGEVELPGGES